MNFVEIQSEFHEQRIGVLIYRGIAIVDNRQILAGAVPAALLALAADALLGLLERRQSKWREA